MSIELNKLLAEWQRRETKNYSDGKTTFEEFLCLKLSAQSQALAVARDALNKLKDYDEYVGAKTRNALARMDELWK